MRTTPPLIAGLRVAAWLVLTVLTLFWMIEVAYCAQFYCIGGWPALLGYLQSTAQGHRSGPAPNWVVIGMWHLAFLAITLPAIWFLRWSRRVGVNESTAPRRPLHSPSGLPGRRVGMNQTLAIAFVLLLGGCRKETDVIFESLELEGFQMQGHVTCEEYRPRVSEILQGFGYEKPPIEYVENCRLQEFVFHNRNKAEDASFLSVRRVIAKSPLVLGHSPESAKDFFRGVFGPSSYGIRASRAGITFWFFGYNGHPTTGDATLQKLVVIVIRE
jgi:hypothetical protein